MATSEEFKNFVLEQFELCESAYKFSARKMFGEYCIYLCEFNALPKPAFLICDETLFVKAHKELEELCKNCDKAPPFKGAKEWFIIDFENQEFLKELIELLAPILPQAKRKNKI